MIDNAKNSSIGDKARTIQFCSGTFVFSNTIIIDQDIKIRGMGSNQTDFVFKVSDGNASCIRIMGKPVSKSDYSPTMRSNTYSYEKADCFYGFDEEYGLPVNGPCDPPNYCTDDRYIAGTNEISISNTQDFNVNGGDLIFIAGGIYSDYGGNVIDLGRFYTTNGVLANNKISLSTPLEQGFDLSYCTYDSYFGTPKITLIPKGTGGIENLAIFRDWGSNNTLGRGGNIRVDNFANGINISGIKSSFCTGAHIQIDRNSYGIQVTGNYCSRAWDRGPGGHGYGVECSGTSSNCYIYNNILEELRHAMLVQYGAYRNTFSYNYARGSDATELWFIKPGDIQIHGGWAYENIFKNNLIEKIWMDCWCPSSFIPGSHISNGPGNRILGNITTKISDTDPQADLIQSGNVESNSLYQSYGSVQKIRHEFGPIKTVSAPMPNIICPRSSNSDDTTGLNLRLSSHSLTPQGQGIFFRAFPNPATDNLNIEIRFKETNSRGKGNLQIKLIDSFGKTLINASGKMSNQSDIFYKSMSIKDFPHGLYILVIDYDGKILTEKIVIN
jgi:Secretion system C-terminal sorting domain